MSTETERIRQIYTAKYAIAFSDWADWMYHPRHPIGHTFRQHNEKCAVRAFNTLGLDVCDKRILDLGCGYGNWLRMFIEWGARPSNAFGVDIVDQRVIFAKQANPSLRIILAEASALPFAEERFDIVMQSVVLSSIRDHEYRGRVAREIVRCLKRGAYVLWLDLRTARSPELASFTLDDVCTLFPGFAVRYSEPVHPEYFYRLAPHSAGLCQLIYDLTKFQCQSLLVVLQDQRRG
jgi:ubiquinone/menaquinone biosynthesis C-methylase UbiE